MDPALAAAIVDASPQAIESIPQTIGAALVRALHRLPAEDRLAASVTVAELSVRLRSRSAEGDHVLAADLEALLLGEDLPGAVEIDLVEAVDVASSRSDEGPGGFLNTTTGETVLAYDAAEDGEGGESVITGAELVDVSGEEWIFLELDGRDDYGVMESFIETVTDPVDAVRLQDAITGSGAFRRFRDTVHRLDLGREWNAFQDDRRLGETRAILAREGIHPV